MCNIYSYKFTNTFQRFTSSKVFKNHMLEATQQHGAPYTTKPRMRDDHHKADQRNACTLTGALALSVANHVCQ